MTESETAYRAIAGWLAALPGVCEGQMFGMPCMKVSGKMFMGYWQGDAVFKLAGQAHAEALALPGTRLFDPSDRGRPMKEWVQVPHAQVAAWAGLADAALAYVSSMHDDRSSR